MTRKQHEGTYEYKSVRMPSLGRGGFMTSRKQAIRKQEQLMNQLATEGWELFDTKRLGAWEFGNKDTLTFRRKRPGADDEPPRS